MVARIRRVTGLETLQCHPCLHLAATSSRYLADRSHNGGRIRHLRMLLVLVPPVLECKCDAGQTYPHEYDDEDTTCDITCNRHIIFSVSHPRSAAYNYKDD